MNVTLFPANRLSDAHVEHWSQLQAANPDLSSPFFHPNYAREAAAVYGNVEVAVLEEDGEPAGYFPFQRTARNVGIPMSGSLCDFQGVIARPGFTWDATALVRACGLAGWRFTQLIAAQQPFQPYHWFTDESHSIDLSEGFDAYCRQRKESGSTFVSRIADKRRKAIRELGPLRFEPYADDPQVFVAMVEWKSQQYRRIRAVNPLTKPGTRDFLKRLLARRDDECHGILSAMYLGERLVAVHMGMRCRNVLHLWFPTYDEDLGKLSPGMIFLVEQIRAAAKLGLQRIDMGRGHEKFKTSLRTFGTPVAEGSVGLGLVSTTVRRSWLYTRKWVQASRFREPARSVVRKVRGLFLRTAH